LDQSVADKIVSRSIEAGVNFIDTANVYSEGLSEKITGRAIVNSGRKRSDVVLGDESLWPYWIRAQ
jgi:aryl-alcohol dehydrogenase-like predicted oxidoreductase